jgi:hypothetical protein
MRRALIYLITGSLFAQIGSPAFAQRRGATGARGGQVQHAGGARRGATTYQGPRGGSAARAYGPRGSVSGARTPSGGSAARVNGRYGGSAAHVNGRYGGSATHVNGRYGGTAYARNSYAWGGRHYYRPGWNANQINLYGRGFHGYPGWRPYGSWGLAPGLAAFSSLAFLSAGLLVGSYASQGNTVYVYVVNEGGQNIEYRVDSYGNILSRRAVD